MSNSPLAIIEFDPSYRVLRWSGDAERIFGWKRDEIVGKAITEIPWVHEEDKAAVAQLSEDMASGRRPRNFSVNRNYRKDGSIIHCEWYNSAIYDRQGRLTSVFSQVLDVTDAKRAEQKILRQTAILEGINRIFHGAMTVPDERGIGPALPGGGRGDYPEQVRIHRPNEGRRPR